MTYPPLRLEGLPFELEWDLLPNYTIRSSNSFEWRKIIFGMIISMGIRHAKAYTLRGRSLTKLGQSDHHLLVIGLRGGSSGPGCGGCSSHRVWSMGPNVLDGGNDGSSGGVWNEKVKALDAKGVVEGSRLGVVWMMLYSGIERARVVSRVVVMIVLLMLRGFCVEELALEAIVFLIGEG
ncbi:hypothetical protein Tco_0144107 [Tanacetum coccineum]